MVDDVFLIWIIVTFDFEKYYYDRRANFLAQRISIDHLPPSFFIGGGNTKSKFGKNILRDDYDNWDVPFTKKSIMLINKTTHTFTKLIFLFSRLNEVNFRGLKSRFSF